MIEAKRQKAARGQVEHQDHQGSNKNYEYSMVVFAHTIVDPWAVMVESGNTQSAHTHALCAAQHTHVTHTMQAHYTHHVDYTLIAPDTYQTHYTNTSTPYYTSTSTLHSTSHYTRQVHYTTQAHYTAQVTTQAHYTSTSTLHNTSHYTRTHTCRLCSVWISVACSPGK